MIRGISDTEPINLDTAFAVDQRNRIKIAFGRADSANHDEICTSMYVSTSVNRIVQIISLHII